MRYCYGKDEYEIASRVAAEDCWSGGVDAAGPARLVGRFVAASASCF